MKFLLKIPWRNPAHPTEGDLRAHLDRQLPGAQQARLEAHLAACQRCQERAKALADRAAGARQRLDSLSPSATFPPLPPRFARARLESRISRKENNLMPSKLFSRAARPAWITLGVIALLLVSLSFQPVRAIAVDFLGLFRIRQVEVVPFNPANLPTNLDDPQFSRLFSEQVEFTATGEVQAASDASQASALAGFPVRLPVSAGEDVKLTVQPGGRLTFHVDLARIRALLKEIGREDILLPDELDGAKIEAELPASVTARIGRCEFTPRVARETGQDPDEAERVWDPQCTLLIQLPSPTVNAPPGLDIAKIGKAYLMMTGMSEQQAEEFSQAVDWATTLVIPVPNYASSQKVQVDGVEGVFIEQSGSRRGNPRYLLIWVKDGRVYALEGQGGQAEALAIVHALE